MQKIIFSKEQKEYIRKELLKKVSLTKIANVLNISDETLRKKIPDIMGKDFNLRRKSYINLNYFEQVDTEEKAYWLGFLAADGYIVHNELNIQLQAQDKKHLEKFSLALNANLTIRDINQTNNFGTRYFHHRVSIQSDKITQDLEKYGVGKNKSLTLSFPKNIDSELIPYWI